MYNKAQLWDNYRYPKYSWQCTRFNKLFMELNVTEVTSTNFCNVKFWEGFKKAESVK